MVIYTLEKGYLSLAFLFCVPTYLLSSPDANALSVLESLQSSAIPRVLAL